MQGEAMMRCSAELSECGTYRYRLARWWDEGPRAVFIMLNPSTADAEQDDPTIRRCIGFARDWKLAGVEVVNLFAIRSTSPDVLHDHPDPIGPRNDEAIRAAAGILGPLIAAWGIDGAIRGRGTHVRAMIGKTLMCLGRTKRGHPRHPLYVPAATKPVPYQEAP